jgi:peptidoglycan pentaglycine glycine transferase (the first glycine)
MSNPNLPWGELQWEKDPPAAEWDHALAGLFGHPLQSCLWGDARRTLDGIVQHRWVARRDGEPIWMIRVEERKVPGGKIAWAPRGPTGRTAELSMSMPPGFEKHFKAEGFSLLISDPWVEIGDGPAKRCDNVRHPKPQTIWIDLSVGEDVVFKNLHKHVRNGVRRAAKAGVSVHTTCDPERIREFVELCSSISVRKGFELRVTSACIKAVLKDSRNKKDVEAVLFVSLKDGKLGAGLFILRAGQSVHLIGAGTNRDLRQERVGEACQWAVIKWAIARGCTRYDLEGIDLANNRSVYDFKKRLGGREITLHGHAHTPLKLSGWAMSRLIRLGGHG